MSRARIRSQSEPDSAHVIKALQAMECVVLQDIFLNETSKYAHVILPGSSFLEKDGTFTNSERRISRVRKVMEPLAGYQDWQITCLLSAALGYPMEYSHPSEIMDEIARLTPTFSGVSYEMLERLGGRGVQWPCNDAAPDGTPTMHVDRFVRGLGKFTITAYIPTQERTSARFPLILTTGRILTQYNVGSQTRRTANAALHAEDLLEIHPHDAEQRGIRDGVWVNVQFAQGRNPPARAIVRADAAGSRVHDVSSSGVADQSPHHRIFGLGDQLPRVQSHCGRSSAYSPARGLRARAQSLERRRVANRGYPSSGQNGE